MENTLTEVKAGGKYVFTFRYSPDLPGYIDALLIRVDTCLLYTSPSPRDS